MPAAGGLVVGSMLAPQLTRVMAPRSVIAAGFAVAAVGFGLFAAAGPSPALGIAVLGSIGLAVHRDTLTQSAPEAFAAGMQVAATTCLAVCAATAVMVLVLLSRSTSTTAAPTTVG